MSVTKIAPAHAKPPSPKSKPLKLRDKPECDRYQADSKRATMIRGSLGGFLVGSSLTGLGIPVAAVIGAYMKGKISSKRAETALKILIPLTFPALMVGAALAGLGAAIGNIVGRVKGARRKKYLALKA